MENNQNYSLELEGKIALVTGGTKGIGKAIAERLTNAGAKVIVTARNQPENLNPQHDFITADLSITESVNDVVKTINEKYDKVDILVNNAGGNTGPAGGFSTLKDEDWESAMQINLFTAIRFDRALLPKMIEQKSGVIIHISSGVGALPIWQTTMPYAASKAALNNYSKALANEVSSKGVRVVTVSPGAVKTGAMEDFLQNLAVKSGITVEKTTKELIAQIGGIPMDRMAEASEVAELVGYLVSPRASYVTGQNYFIDGGAKPVV